MKNIKKLGIPEPILITKSVEKTFTKILLEGYKYNPKNYLSSGREIPHLKIRPRELLGLCIMSHLGNYLTGENWLPATDPWGRDGSIIVERDGIRVGMVIEQVYVGSHSKGDLTKNVLQAIKKKEDRGKSYTDDVNLVVFVDTHGELEVEMIAKRIQNSPFGAIYLFGLADPKDFLYFAAILKSPSEPLSSVLIKVNHKTGRAALSVINKHKD